MKAETLKQELRRKRDNMQENHAVRLHRAVSWLACAEEQRENLDLAFISLWIAFNACYSVDDGSDYMLSERQKFQDFLYKLVKHDADKAIYNCLWKEFSGPVKALINNHYVFKPFWDAQYQGGDESIWKPRYEKSQKAAMTFLAKQKVPELLGVVLDRLYILRNQMMHGGATYQSQVNREQVRDGANMLFVLLPNIISIMMDSENEDWGEIYYPVIGVKK